MSGHSSHSGPGHETTDVTFNQGIWLIPLSMILLITYVLVCLFGATSSLSREMARKQTMGAEAGHEALAAFRAHEDSSMHEYGWMDKDKGMVKIPIEHAMEMMAKEAAQTKAP